MARLEAEVRNCRKRAQGSQGAETSPKSKVQSRGAATGNTTTLERAGARFAGFRIPGPLRTEVSKDAGTKTQCISQHKPVAGA